MSRCIACNIILKDYELASDDPDYCTHCKQESISEYDYVVDHEFSNDFDPFGVKDAIENTK